jgi:hypothetical protein
MPNATLEQTVGVQRKYIEEELTAWRDTIATVDTKYDFKD